MSRSLSERPNLDWLRKTAKQALKQLREHKPSARLADAQLAVAREYGFDSWRKLVRHVQVHGVLNDATTSLPAGIDEALIASFLRLDARGWAETAVTVTNNPNCAIVADFLARLERQSET